MPTTKAPWIIRKLHQLTYPQKFILICILFALSLLIAGYFMVKAQNAEIRFAELELKGTTYERALRRLLERLPQHKLLSTQYLNGDTSVNGELLNLSTQINADFKFLNNIDTEYENALSTTPRDFEKSEIGNLKSRDIEERWNELNKHLSDVSSETSDRLHDQLIENIRSLVLYIGETSNLILDPTLEAIYFIDALLTDLPEGQILIPKMMTVGQNIHSSGESENPQKKELLQSLSDLLKQHLENTQSSLHRGFVGEKKIRFSDESESKLKDPILQYLDAGFAFLKYTKEKILTAEKKPWNISEYIEAGNKALDNNFILWDATIVQLDNIIKTRVESLKTEQRWSILAILLTSLIGFLLGLLIMREISRPLSNLVKAAKHLAEGDLSTRVDVMYDDEVGQVGIAFNHMAQSFQELIGQLQWTGIQLTSSTSEIAATANQQEAVVIQQESTTKQIASTAQEITTTAKEFAKTMNEISNTAEQTSALAASGKEGLNKMEFIMRQMVNASQNIATKLAVLNEKANNITSVVTTITKVADRTNLLSLNASIEAEKAGEHGRTFSVIAREIRRLADQTGNATLDIERMVNEMISAVAAGVMSVDKFSEEIHTGVGELSNVSGHLSKIIEQVQQQTESFEDVNKGMQTQTLSADQINESITHLSESAQQATESIRQFHTAIKQLNNAAQEMQSAILKIKR